MARKSSDVAIALSLSDGSQRSLRAVGISFHDDRVAIWSKDARVESLPVKDIDRLDFAVSPSYSVEQLRAEHPNAYAPWTEDDDQLLAVLVEQGLSTRELSEEFGR